jgi:hypothetical protein
MCQDMLFELSRFSRCVKTCFLNCQDQESLLQWYSTGVLWNPGFRGGSSKGSAKFEKINVSALNQSFKLFSLLMCFITTVKLINLWRKPFKQRILVSYTLLRTFKGFCKLFCLAKGFQSVETCFFICRDR